jgi:Domain of unknown function (DUF4287)
MLGSTPSGRAQGSVSPAAATETKEVAVTEKRSFKRRVRERMSKTGESYSAARTQMPRSATASRVARTRLAAADERVSDAKIKEATGKKWDQWFSILDRGGARDKKHGEIARFLTDTHDVEGWWAQSITVGYERARGMRLKYQQSDGFTISASKTIAVPLDVLFDAFVDGRKRKRWLTDGTMSLRTSQPGRSARFDWEDGSTRVNVGFTAKSPSKSTVALAHERLADADEAETAKALWKERLAELKSFLEA